MTDKKNNQTYERATGRMSGALKNTYFTDPVVIDYGSRENAYKAVTTMRLDQGLGAGSNIYALNVAEYEEDEKKPFVFLWNGTVFFGQCIHF